VKRRVRGKRTTKRLDHLRIGFRRQQLSADGYVFPGKLSGKPLEIKRVGNWFRAVLKAAGLGRFKMYDLRHSYASQLLMQRVKAVDVAEVMGHKTIAPAPYTVIVIESLPNDGGSCPRRRPGSPTAGSRRQIDDE
jgi:integrase